MSETLRYLCPGELAGLGRTNAVVESSAGTGKTYLLEHLFVDLILRHGLSCEQILVVTFTEKATAELVLRLRALLERLVHLRADDPMVLAAAKADPASTSSSTSSSTWLIDRAARARLAENLLGFDRASISTIHGFCQRVLREHAFVQSRFFDEEVVANQAIFARAFREVLRNHPSDRELADALVLWLASGRTVRDLEEVLGNCEQQEAMPIRPSFDPQRLQEALTLWSRLPRDLDLKRRLRDAGVHASTVRAIVDRTVHVSEIVAASAGDNLKALAAYDRLCQGKTQGKKDTFDVLREKLPSSSADDVLAATAHAAHALAAALVPLEALLADRMLPLVRERASTLKRHAGCFDFSDMLALVARALGEPTPGTPPLLDALRRRYRHALIDEFQDTDETQWSIFRRIFCPTPSAGPASHALTVIGDPKQAIYGFRGADVHAYLRARRQLLERGASHVVLDRNFRCTEAMVAATNVVFDQNAGAGFFRAESGIRYDVPVRCGRPDLALDGDARHGGKPIVVLDVKSDTAKLTATRAATALRTAIVDEIAELIAPASPLRLRSSDGERCLRARSIFVLTFTNAESRAIGKALRAAGIAHAFYKLGNLFNSAEAEEVLSLLRAICQPERRGLRAQAFLTRFFAMDVTTAATALDLGAEAAASKLLFRFAALAARGDIPGLFSAIADESGLVCRELYAGNDERTITNVTHVLEILQDRWARTHASLPELVDLLAGYISGTEALPAQDGDLQRLETDKDAVQILTVHKAKGLEADVVFLYGGISTGRSDAMHVVHEGEQRSMHVGRLDADLRQRVAQQKVDEHARLLYVALTRARFRMYLPHLPPVLRAHVSYERVNQRLNALVTDPAAGQLFALRDCVEGRRSSNADADSEEGSGMSPPIPPELLRAEEPADIGAIRASRAGFLVTSYSAIKRSRHALNVDQGLDVRFDNVDRDATSPDKPDRPDSASVLAGGAETGIFLHDLLATVALDDLTDEFSTWVERLAVTRWLQKARIRHGRTEAEIGLAARLVHRAYTSPVRLGTMTLASLRAARALVRETEFLFPIPEKSHPLLSQPEPRESRWKIERGAVRGFIDLLFEHDDRIVVCDWKSDTLTDFSPEALARHCHEHYDMQARLYILAALRLAGIDNPQCYDARFGGMLFFFLRGVDNGDSTAANGAGIYFFKPTWQNVLDGEREMLFTRVLGRRAMSWAERPMLLPTGTARQVLGNARGPAAELLELCRTCDMDESAVFLAWQTAEMAPELPPAERASLMNLLGRLLVAQATGSTCLGTTESERRVLLQVPELVQVQAQGQSDVPGARARPAAPKPLVLDGEHLYHAKAHGAETRVAQRLRALFERRATFPAAEIARAIDDAATTASPIPSSEQKAAVANVLGRHLGVISGGPGTGKTTTVLALVRSLVRLGVDPKDIGLAAPTGKAASRLEADFRGRLAAIMPFSDADRALRASCPQAQTLHRLLRASRGPGGSLHTTTDPLPFRVLVVDESSMIDLVLMDRLLAALADDATLVLLGDADQLPSVESGAVFRDLSQWAVRLERGFRADSSRAEGKSIAELAVAIRKANGGAAARLYVSRQHAAEVAWQGVEHLAAAGRAELLRAFHQRTYRNPSVLALTAHDYRIDDGAVASDDTRRLDELAGCLGRSRILGVTRGRAAGIDRCNAFLHDLQGGGPSLIPGEPLLVSRNDYERDLWNGDQGVAIRVRGTGTAGESSSTAGYSVWAAFRTRSGWRAFDPKALGGTLELGFALTVHKAQGSEMDEALVLLPDFPSPLLTRELLYTAVSRARRSVVLCGDAALFANGVAAGERRDSQLAQRLRDA